MRGGRRSGAGRKRGSLSTRTQEIVAAATREGITPLEFLLEVLRDESKPFGDRYRAAVDGAPYLHPRLAAVDYSGEIAPCTHEEALAELEKRAALVANGSRGDFEHVQDQT